MKYLEVIENEFQWDLKHYKKLVLSSNSNNKNLQELIKKLNIIVDFYLKHIREYEFIMVPQDIVKDLKVSRYFIDTQVLPQLNTLYLPTKKEGSWLFKQIFHTKLNNEEKRNYKIRNLVNSKVIICKNDYLKYLESNK